MYYYFVMFRILLLNGRSFHSKREATTQLLTKLNQTNFWKQRPNKQHCSKINFQNASNKSKT